MLRQLFVYRDEHRNQCGGFEHTRAGKKVGWQQNLLPEAGEDESDTWQGGALLLVDYGTD